MSSFEKEVKKGERFQFGKNWHRFLSVLNEERIKIAENSLKEMLRKDNLEDYSFVDAGCGSGLFSLAARRLGAKVYSFDYDPQSVACTKELKRRYFSNDSNWEISQGSVLDADYLKTLGQFDIVYSWGVLHHTGDMWSALNNVVNLVGKQGYLFIAIYNDQGFKSKFWTRVKKTYCSGMAGKILTLSIFIPYFFIGALAASMIKRENVFRAYKKNRGMSIYHDWIDWLGGYPFEVAKVEDIFNFYFERGFNLFNIKTSCGLGNNQFVFKRSMPG